jgi:hypothetical protein
MTEFANFVSSYDQQNQSGGAGACYVGPPNPVLLPPVNVLQAGGGGYVLPPPTNAVPYVAPPLLQVPVPVQVPIQ